MPEVSVVIPAFNAAATILDAIDSVLSQTYGDHEVIVVDDGSSDATGRMASSFGGRVRVMRTDNGGPGRARNIGIAASTGRFLAFLDADDVWLPEKLERQIGYFGQYPRTGLLHTGTWVGTFRGTPKVPRARQAGAEDAPSLAFCDLFHTRLDISTLTVMVPRAVIDEVGLFDESRDVHVEDWEMWLRIAARFPVGCIREPLAVHRPGGMMSGAFEKTYQGQRLVIERYLPLCHKLCASSRGAIRECRDRRLHRLYWELGYNRFRKGDRRQARRAFRTALAHRLDALTLAHFVAASFPTPVVSSLRRLLRRPSTRSQPDLVRRVPVRPVAGGRAFAGSRSLAP